MGIHGYALTMVGTRPSCRGCGAPIKKAYEYCNVCGRRNAAVPEDGRNAPISPPKILLNQAAKKGDRVKRTEDLVPRRELVIMLLAMTMMSPFCVWLSSLGGLVGIGAAFNEELYGRYVVLLAALGLFMMLAEDRLPASFPKRMMMAGVGIGTVALTVLDYLEIMKYNMSSGPFLIEAEPGIGMYLALVMGIALPLAVLIPKRKRVPLKGERPVLRPGSRGSGP